MERLIFCGKVKAKTTPKPAKAKANYKKMGTQTQMNKSEVDGVNMPDISSLTSELQNLEWWYNTWSKISLGIGIFTAVLALLAAAAGVVAYWYSVRLKPVQDTLSQAKEDQLARDLKDKEAKIAATGEATARVDAESREKAAQLTKEAEALRTDAEKARANIATAKADAFRANERAQELEQENLKLRTGVAKLEIEAANAKTTLVEVQRRQGPRSLRLPRAVSEAFGREPKGEVEILYPKDVGEAARLAEDIYTTLHWAQWNVSDPKPFELNQDSRDSRILSLMMNGYWVTGTDVFVVSRSLGDFASVNLFQPELRPLAALMSVLEAGHLRVNFSADPKLSSNSFRVVVAPKL